LGSNLGLRIEDEALLEAPFAGGLAAAEELSSFAEGVGRDVEGEEAIPGLRAVGAETGKFGDEAAGGFAMGVEADPKRAAASAADD
jgi:hypothetical protein